VALSCNDPGASIIAPPGDSQHIDIVPAKTKRTHAGVGDDRFGHLAALLHRHDVDEMQGSRAVSPRTTLAANPAAWSLSNVQPGDAAFYGRGTSGSVWRGSRGPGPRTGCRQYRL